MGIGEICGLDLVISEAAATWRTRTRAQSMLTHVGVVVYCCLHNLDRGFIIYLKFIKPQLTMGSTQSDSANRTVLYSIMCMH
jgi:hypothetical protein